MSTFSPTDSGLFIPEDGKQRERARLVSAARQTARLLSEAGIGEIANPHLTQALAPEIFRQLYHQQLVD